MAEANDITRMLREIDDGQDGAMDRLMEAVYADLTRLAEKHLGERFGHGLAGVTMEPAALVNESFMKLIRQRNRFDNRGQFFAIATRVMLRVLVDYQRSRAAAKRGGDRRRVTLSIERPATEDAVPGEGDLIDVDVLVRALDRLEQLDCRKADVVRLRVIWGLEMREVAGALDISLATVERDWSFSKAWLAREAAAA